VAVIEAQLYAALLERLPELACEVTDRLVADLPLYDRLSEGEAAPRASRSRR
jgi:NAD(P)H-dependent FMN reductase